MSGRIRYEVYDSSTSAASMNVLAEVSDVIVNRTGESFQGTWMLLVEWEDCHPSPHGQSSLSGNSYLQQVHAVTPCLEVGAMYTTHTMCSVHSSINRS